MSQVSVPASSSKTSCLYNFHKFKKKEKIFLWLNLPHSSLVYRSFFSYCWTPRNKKKPPKEKQKKNQKNPKTNKQKETLCFQNLLRDSSSFFLTPIKSGSSDHMCKWRELVGLNGGSARTRLVLKSSADISNSLALPLHLYETISTTAVQDGKTPILSRRWSSLGRVRIGSVVRWEEKPQNTSVVSQWVYQQGIDCHEIPQTL